MNSDPLNQRFGRSHGDGGLNLTRPFRPPLSWLLRYKPGTRSDSQPPPLASLLKIASGVYPCRLLFLALIGLMCKKLRWNLVDLSSYSML